MRTVSALFFLPAILLGYVRADLSGEETKTLDQLYQDAIKEGGKLVVYHGGDTAGRQDRLRDAFMAVFPKINTTIIVDYSKYQDVRIDNQLATNNLVPDVVALQTLQDFPRWKNEGHLLHYKPANFSKIYDEFKDPDGAWYGYSVYSFTSTSNTTTLNGLPAPKTPLEIVDPMYKGLIASSYPHDDDAVLFLFSKYVEKYGWEWAAKFATQDVSFNRGTYVQGDLVRAGTKAIGVGGGGSHAAAVAGGYPFLAWAQRLAILKKSKNTAAAKLFVNWAFTEERQRTGASTGWTVRTDIPTTNGFPQVWDIDNAHVSEFAVFMKDRERVEIWKQTFALYFGEVQGAPTPGWPGLYPGRS
ncbi:Abc superfamily, partial [Globisporangium splendens]